MEFAGKSLEELMLPTHSLSEGEREEMKALGVLSPSGELRRYTPPRGEEGRVVTRRAIVAPAVLNEAYDYPRPSSFSRGTRLDLGAYTLLLISGTASVDERGASVHI